MDLSEICVWKVNETNSELCAMAHFGGAEPSVSTIRFGCLIAREYFVINF
jgi:hypothetical protein